jgi:hypothetical protein
MLFLRDIDLIGEPPTLCLGTDTDPEGSGSGCSGTRRGCTTIAAARGANAPGAGGRRRESSLLGSGRLRIVR